MIKKTLIITMCSFVLTAGLQIRLSHDNKRGYSYNITGPSWEEVVETDQKLKKYIKSQAPKKNAGLVPVIPTPKPSQIKK
ncbi:MAG: hypothetical protein V2B13_19105 [Pseudomonadota bacterium]